MTSSFDQFIGELLNLLGADDRKANTLSVSSSAQQKQVMLKEGRWWDQTIILLRTALYAFELIVYNSLTSDSWFGLFWALNLISNPLSISSFSFFSKSGSSQFKSQAPSSSSFFSFYFSFYFYFSFMIYYFWSFALSIGLSDY